MYTFTGETVGTQVVAHSARTAASILRCRETELRTSAIVQLTGVPPYKMLHNTH